MRVNADFDSPVFLHTAQMEWQASPLKGVERRMLDRIGGEVARATSLVRYAPGSRFSAHTHDGGEEFIVLEGTFQDEHGDYPAGTYVRNPVGTHHIPRSKEGCTIFVKLWQFDRDDTAQFACDLSTLALQKCSRFEGVLRAVLCERAEELVRVEAWEPGCTRSFGHPDGAELLVLEGALVIDEEVFDRHDWLRLPPGDEREMVAAHQGARIWLKTGHLRKVRAPSQPA